MEPVEKSVGSTFLDIMSNGYMIRGMDKFVVAAGGATVRIELRLDGTTLKDEPVRVPETTKVSVLSECLSVNGNVKKVEHMTFGMFMGKDLNARTKLLEIIESSLSEYVAGLPEGFEAHKRQRTV